MSIILSQITAPLPNTIKDKLGLMIKKGIERAPKHALIPFALLPNTIQEKVLTWAINHLFKAELINEELDFLIDKCLMIAITDANYRCYISVHQTDNARQCKVTLAQHKLENVAFEAHSTSLLQLFGQTVDPDTLFFQRKLLITGDTELGLEIKNFLDDIDRDAFPAIVKQLLLQYNVLNSKF